MRRRSSFLAIFLALVLVVAIFAMTRIVLIRADDGRPTNFALIDDQNRPVTSQTYRGRYQLIYFGYTHCPDVCPLTLGHVVDALSQLGDERGKIVPLFITVDPARDTIATLHDYVGNFAGIVGLTGSNQAIAEAEASFGVYAARHELDHSDYTMDHTSILYLIDPEGHLATTFQADATPDDLARRLKAVL